MRLILGSGSRPGFISCRSAIPDCAPRLGPLLRDREKSCKVLSMDINSQLNYSGDKPGDPPRLGIPATIHDARADRGVVDEPTDSTNLLLNGEGFLLAHAPSAVADWADPQEVIRLHYAEALALVQRLLPAFEFAPLTSHTFRTEDIKDHHFVDGIQYGPCAAFVHNDFADFLTADRKVDKTFAEVMDMPTDRRVIALNVWRSVTDTPLERNPLAVCDRTSIEPDDLVYELNPNAPKPFNAHFCHPNPAQRWNYYSGMTKDEALVFTTYDSNPEDGRLFRPTLHSSVPIPDSEGLTPRVSIEVRFFGYL